MVIFDLEPCFEFETERREERKTVKMINEHTIKALLKNRIIYNLELIYSHGLVSEMTSLSMLLLMRPKNLLLARLAKLLVLKKCFCFYQEIRFSFFPIFCELPW